MLKSLIVVAALIVFVVIGAYWFGTQYHAVGITDSSSISTVVEQFGTTMQKVSLAAPDAKSEIGAAYSPYVSADLIVQWQNNPSFAPGRGTSSPWPDHIQVESTALQPDGSYVVQGTVIEVTSYEVAHGGVAAQFPVTLTLKKFGDQWLITQYQPGALTVTASTTAQQ